MDLEQIFKKDTGFDAYMDNDLRPKVPNDYYVEWLEENLVKLIKKHKHNEKTTKTNTTTNTKKRLIRAFLLG